jgi:K+-transporting ATPase ATPase A chain
MNISGWIQLAFYVLVLLLITKPLGLYLVQVLNANGKTFLDPVVRPIERLTYRILGVKPDREQNWIQYAVALLIFSVVSMIFTYGILRCRIISR